MFFTGIFSHRSRLHNMFMFFFFKAQIAAFTANTGMWKIDRCLLLSARC